MESEKYVRGAKKLDTTPCSASAISGRSQPRGRGMAANDDGDTGAGAGQSATPPCAISLVVSGVIAAGAAVATGFLIRRILAARASAANLPPEEERRERALRAALAREWLSRDPDARTRALVSAWAVGDRSPRGATDDGLLPHDQQDQTHGHGDGGNTTDEMENRLDESKRLRFGTAGLRARMGVGYDRMNACVVMSATQGVLSVMREANPAVLRVSGVAIGYDGRHESQKFAQTAAAVFAQQDVPVRFFSRPVPTPLVAFSVLEYGLCGAIMVTASHNPPEDNGYKLYWSNGAQIRPPRDRKIESAIRRESRPWADYSLDEQRLRMFSNVQDPTDECMQAYISQASSGLRWRSRERNSTVAPAVYTACHGVGYEAIKLMFHAFGLPPVLPVEEQTLEPDPDFPTLPKPNPEEAGALDMAIAKARACGARIVLANDPDADRLGAAELSPDGRDVRVFTGDEIALLLTDYILARYDGDHARLGVVASTVSSKMLRSMAQTEGFSFREELTGFKWLSKGADDLRQEGKTVVLAYEEAIGFMIGDTVNDKDGVTAAAVFAEMAGYRHEQGITLQARLETLWRKYGYHMSCNGYLRIPHSATPLPEIFDKARARGLPTSLGGCSVVSVRDLTKGTDTGKPDGTAALPADPKSQFLTFTCRSRLSEGNASSPDVVISLRGSGTEPKVKHYAELRCEEKVAKDGSGQALIDAVVRDAIDQVLRPSENGLR